MSYGHIVKKANLQKEHVKNSYDRQRTLQKKNVVSKALHANFAIGKFLRASIRTWVSTSLAAKSLRHSSLLLPSFGSWSRSWVTAAGV